MKLPMISSARKTVDLSGHAMRVLDIPGLGSFDIMGGSGQSRARYIRSPWAFACMQIRGSELANLPWHLVDRTSGKIIERHPILTMLTEFGPESNYKESVLATEIEMCMGAAAFWVRDADLLQRLNAGTVKVKANRTGIQGFEQWVQGKKVNTFARDEVVYFHEFNPDNDLLPGPSIMDVVKAAVEVEHEAGMFVTAHLRNDATPSLFVSSDQPIPQTELERLAAWWDKRFGGPRNKGKTAFGDRGLQAKVLSAPLKDLGLTDQNDQMANSICVGFRVPRLLVGQFVEATYANAGEARVYLLENVIIPRAGYYEETINVDLVWKIDPNVSFRFAPQELAILQDGVNKKAERLSTLLEKGVISPEYFRQQMNIPESAAPAEVPEQTAAPAATAEQAEMRSWRRKAVHALRAGRAADVPFECFSIHPSRQSAIRAALQGAGVDDLDRIFGLAEPGGQRTTIELPPINIEIKVPEQMAPIVQVAAPEVHVDVAAPDVRVEPPAVTVNVPKQPRIIGTTEAQAVERTPAGTLTGTTKQTAYQYEDEDGDRNG